MSTDAYAKIFSSSSGQWYVYITQTNEILSVDKDWFDSLDEYTRELVVLDELTKAGLLSDQIPDQIQWGRSKEEYQRQIAKRIPALTLEMTQQCSLRCSYCIYSGNYDGVRVHQPCDMDLSLITGAIDYFAEHNADCPTADISFYGGEALLQFDKIRYAVEYAREKIRHKPLRFHVSTNGTTLTSPVQQWLSQNEDVTVAITLNGPTHDVYRKFPSGAGSLDVITQHLQEIRENYANVWDRIDFLANISSYSELLALRKYYLENVGKPPLLISGIEKEGGNDFIQTIIGEGFQNGAEQKVSQNLFISRYDEYLKPFYQANVESMSTRSMGNWTDCAIAPCCIPFTHNLFVSAKGELSFCERTTPKQEYGNVVDGISTTAVEKAMDQAMSVFNSKCRLCWAQRLCDVCYQYIREDSSGVAYISESFCEQAKCGIIKDLILFCDISEENPSLVEKIRLEHECKLKRHQEEKMGCHPGG
ncbi:MAG: radical SAM protein [Clostridiales bacterium]|nr:radical SAM protein [Clostridiales bacterium]